MQIDALAIRLRWSRPTEAADCGVRLGQAAMAQVYACFLLTFLPIVALAIASRGVAGWLPFVILWWSKPWLDRSILFVLARAAFGTRTAVTDLWRAQRDVWWGQWWRTWTLRRLSASRAMTQAAIQLERQRGKALRQRLRVLRQGQQHIGRAQTLLFASAEAALYIGILSMVFWFKPPELGFNELWAALFSTESSGWYLAQLLAYACAIAIVEPAYVAAGFGLYLCRRVELEAWDLEQDLRHAFAA